MVLASDITLHRPHHVIRLLVPVIIHPIPISEHKPFGVLLLHIRRQPQIIHITPKRVPNCMISSSLIRPHDFLGLTIKHIAHALLVAEHGQPLLIHSLCRVHLELATWEFPSPFLIISTVKAKSRFINSIRPHFPLHRFNAKRADGATAPCALHGRN